MKSNICKSLWAGALLLSGVHVIQAQPEAAAQANDTVPASSDIRVAYGQVRQEALTYSVSTVNGKDIANSPAYLAGNSLFGKLPGLTVVQRTGEPGNDAPTFFLRGRSTTRTSAPLVMVDGIERDLNDIQLEDIENITVLKDASSSVVYGIRGANGVILVTTKRGRPGKLNVSANVQQGVMAPTRTPEFVGSADFVKLYNQALSNDGLAPLYTPEQISGYENGDRFYYPDVDWQKEVTNAYASGTKANLNVSGGDNTAAYYVSFGYFHQGGIYRNTDMNEGYSTNVGLNNISFKSNLDLNVNENWSFALDLGGRIYSKNAPVSSTASIWETMYKYPSNLFPVYVQDGVYGGSSVYPDNPVGYVNSKGYRKTNNRVILSSLSTKYNFDDVIQGLSAGLRFSVDNFYSNQEGYKKNFLVKELLGQDDAGGPRLSPAVGTNTNLVTLSSSGYPLNDAQNKRNTFEGNIQYMPELASGNDLNVQLIYHQDRLIIGSESPYNYQFVSGRVNYGLSNRYFAEIGASYSGTEAFPKGNRFGFFPAASAAWVLSEEDFMKASKAFNLLKLRVSAGAVGNSAVGERFSNLSQYMGDDGYNFGNANAGQAGSSAGLLPNNNFTWETAYKYDAGVDTRLFNGIDISLTWFFERRKDILVPQSNVLPDIFGGDLPAVNAGITHSTGFESSIHFARQKAQWGYRIGVNASYARNIIKSIPEPVQPYSYLYKAGHRIDQPFMLEAIGFFGSDEEILNSPVQTFGEVQPGDIKYKDQNGDNRIDQFDEVAINHSTLPSFDFGFDLGFNVKNFEVTAFFQGQAGRSIYLGSAPYLFWPLTNDGARIAAYPKQFWTEETKATADYPRLTTMDNQNNYRESSFWYVNGDFLRLRSLDVAYNVPQRIAGRAGLTGMRIFVRGMNLLTLDHLKYADPEVLSGYPVMRSYNAGINLQF